MVKIAPSLLSADFGRLKEEIETIETAGADFLHVDVMDGHFVPNITIGPLIVEAVKRSASVPLDVHLMIENPDLYLQDFADAGSDYITVHVEACTHLQRTLTRIRELGCLSGVAFNPATPLSTMQHILNDVDMVLIMSVNPGFGGQKFIPSALWKLKQLKDILSQFNSQILVEVDGGVTHKNSRNLIKAGANILVAGSAVFNNPEFPDYGEAIRQIRGT
jgi:ribulose-phosphate 3-epimerase